MLRKPARIMQEDVMDQTNVLTRYQIPISDYLAGWWSVTKDADSLIRCGFSDMKTTAAD